MRFPRPVVVLLLALGIVASASVASAAAAAPTTLRVGLVRTEGGSLDAPLLSYLDAINPTRLFLEPLYDIKPSGALVPRLAAGQPKVTNGGRRITVALRSARWSDGTPIGGADVVASVTRALKPSNGAYFANFLGSVSKVSAASARTVRIDLRRADPIVPKLLASQLFTPTPAHVVRRAGNAWWTSPKAAWSGPYRVTSRTGSTIVGTRNARYPLGGVGARPATVTLRFMSDSALRTSLRSGALDVGLQNMLGKDESVARTPLATTWIETMGTQYLYLNTTSPRLTDPHVRRAIALAVDRAGIATTMHGTPLAGVLPTTVPGGPQSVAGPRLLSTTGSPDPAAATAELAAGSWTSTTKLQLIYVSGSSGAATVAQAVQTSLAAVGVHVVLVPVSSRMMSTVGYGISPVRAANDLVLQGWIADYPDPYDWYQLFLCRSVKDGLNGSNWCSNEYDAAARPLLTEYSWPRRVATFQRLEQLLTGPDGAMPAVPLYQQRDRIDVNRRVRGLRVTSDGVIHWDAIRLAR
jgi:ABC-type transport system substrate-binding protein